MDTYISPIRSQGISNLINGAAHWAASAETFETISPIDGSKICSVASGRREDIDLAAKAATAAFPS